MAVSRRGFCLLGIVLVVIGFAIGFLSGYLGRKDQYHKEGPCLDGVNHKIVEQAESGITQKLLDEIKPENIRQYLKHLTERPHLAGTPADLEQAEELVEFWRQNGLDSTKITPYDVLLSYPDAERPNNIKLLDGNDRVIHQSQLVEKILRPEQNQSDVVPPFNAYSAAGSPKGDVIYVNYARVEDFTWLTKVKGINVTGKIVIARYGKIFRGSKVANAEQFGAVGLIFYTDPADYAIAGVTEVYPHSWWLPGTGVQRGTTVDLVGDPLTPGYPAIKSAFRISEDEALIPRIPVHPVGYDDAEVILSHMTGEEVVPDWRGALNITYRFGPGFKQARWKVQMNIFTQTQNVTTYNAFGFIRGSIEPDRYVLVGNHRDAWVFGAVDPSSGTAVEMEVARAMAKLVREGWRPRRTVVFCSWGAEEYGLVGSREWVEHFSELLRERTVAYLNIDIAVQGNFTLRGKTLPMMNALMYDVAKKIPNPSPSEVAKGRQTIYDTWKHGMPEVDKTGKPTGRPRIILLGSGSDHEPFISLLGVSAAEFRYYYDESLGLSSYPLYHSVYETFHLVDNIMDPGFKFHQAIARYMAEFARTLADSLILPFQVTAYPAALKEYLDNIEQRFGSIMRQHGLEQNLDFLRKAIDQFNDSADQFQKRVDNANVKNPLEMRQLNDQMMSVDRSFIDPLGLPGRPFKRHVVFAPSAHNTYAGSTFPGLVDSLFEIESASPDEEPKRWRLVRKQLSVITFFIEAAAATLGNVTDF